MVVIIRGPATREQLKEMEGSFGSSFIKLAVDIKREILAGGGEFHSDCEQALLDDGSQQIDIWGADWHPDTRKVTFESMINIRPQQQNFGMEVQDLALRSKIEQVVRALLEVSNE
jgi:hypothetical protein